MYRSDFAKDGLPRNSRHPKHYLGGLDAPTQAHGSCIEHPPFSNGKSASVYESVRFDLHENPAPRTPAPKHLLKRLPIQFVDDQGRGSTSGWLVTRAQSLRLAEKLWRNWRQRHNDTKHFV